MHARWVKVTYPLAYPLALARGPCFMHACMPQTRLSFVWGTDLMAAAALTRVLPRARLRSAGLLATRAQSTIVYHALPTPDVAREMPRHVSDLTNETLYMLSMSGSHEAVRERLRREIMFVDGVASEVAAAHQAPGVDAD